MVSETPFVVSSIQSTYVFARQIQQAEKVQNLIGIVNFALGFKGAHNLMAGTHLSQKDVKQYENLPKWKIQALKAIHLMGNLSLVGYAVTSRPALYVWKAISRTLATSHYVIHLLGPHPLLPSSQLVAITTIASILLGIPSTVKVTLDSYDWLKKKITPSFDMEMSDSPPLFRQKDFLVAITTIIESVDEILSYLFKH